MDTSLQKNLEAEILAYKYALDQSCIVAITDQKGIIRYVNDNFCRISRYNADELIGQDHRIINSGYHSKAFIRELWVTIANGHIWKGELKNRTKDGTIYWVDTTIVPFLDEQRKPYQYIAIRADITERKLAEEAFRRSEIQIRELNETLERKVAERTRELELSNQELEAFSYSISHDLRAPLRAINGYARVLEEDYGPAIDEEGKRALDVIRENASRMGTLIDDLLAFARLGRQEINKSRVDMTELAHQILRELPAASIQNIHIHVLPLESAFADKALIKQALSNYLLNAIKYSAYVQQPAIDISSIREKKRVIYSVSDNGAGFDMDYAHKLFGVFQRLHSSSEFEGTGVGLAIVKRIITRHGGDVWAEGQRNKGATFYFSLPI